MKILAKRLRFSNTLTKKSLKILADPGKNIKALFKTLLNRAREDLYEYLWRFLKIFKRISHEFSLEKGGRLGTKLKKNGEK